ncbi:MAG: trypsin-like peptidase domain-containing protein [Planctomycetaceae bacterium]|nr:trypsin-like peptidase domain-containing protein [Planctomycetaceae bacterium]
MPSRFAFALLFCLSTVCLAANPRGVVYDFGATWCGPCQQIAPLVEKLEREGLPIHKVDIDQQKELANRFRIERIPTFVLVVDGKEVDRHTGALSEADLRKMVARIPSAKPADEGKMAISVELGQAGAWNRDVPQANSVAQVQTREDAVQTPVPGKSPGQRLRDLWPFDKDKKAPPEEAVVRATDSELGETEETIATLTSQNTVSSDIDPMAASVRIRVIINGSVNLGSGTIIDSEPGTTRILTCGHIFRGFSDDAKIEVDVFEEGVSRLHVARLIKFNEEADLGLISISTPQALPALRVASADRALEVGEQVAAIGCNGGDDPTRQQLRITDVDKYNGPNNIECTGLPVQGRSGGGLFGQQGEVIGVCVAADRKGQRGLYTGLYAIHDLLDECQLAHLYRTPGSNSEQQAIADNERPEAAPFPIQTADLSSTVPAASPQSPSIPSMSAEPVDLNTGSAEVVVIVRDRNAPNGQRIVILHQASPKFLNYLNGELTPESVVKTAAQKLKQSSEHVPTTAALPTTPVATELAPTGFSQPVIPRRFTRGR